MSETLPPESPSFAAILPTPPPTLAPWAKVLWYLAETVAIGVVHEQFDYAGPIAGTPQTEGDPSGTTWRHLQVIAQDTLSNETADDQVFTLDLVNYTNGTVDNTWTSTDYASVDTALQAFLNIVKTCTVARMSFTGYRSYVRQFNPMSISKPFADSGPPEHIRSWTIAATGVGAMPPQPCTTVTEKTPSPRNWGRFYLPTLSNSVIDPSGYLSVNTVGTLATAARDMYAALYAVQLIPVVPTTQVQRSPMRTLQGITAVQVDTVTDVVRRRRLKTVSSRTSLPVAAELLE